MSDPVRDYQLRAAQEIQRRIDSGEYSVPTVDEVRYDLTDVEDDTRRDVHPQFPPRRHPVTDPVNAAYARIIEMIDKMHREGFVPDPRTITPVPHDEGGHVHWAMHTGDPAKGEGKAVPLVDKHSVDITYTCGHRLALLRDEPLDIAGLTEIQNRRCNQCEHGTFDAVDTKQVKVADVPAVDGRDDGIVTSEDWRRAHGYDGGKPLHPGGVVAGAGGWGFMAPTAGAGGGEGGGGTSFGTVVGAGGAGRGRTLVPGMGSMTAAEQLAMAEALREAQQAAVREAAVRRSEESMGRRQRRWSGYRFMTPTVDEVTVLGAGDRTAAEKIVEEATAGAEQARAARERGLAAAEEKSRRRRRFFGRK